jgi:hypothetical protein
LAAYFLAKEYKFSLCIVLPHFGQTPQPLPSAITLLGGAGGGVGFGYVGSGLLAFFVIVIPPI